MSGHFHLTRLQRHGILKWTLYALLFFFFSVNQTVVMSRIPIFGIRLNFLPMVVICICLREGAERGGIFSLIALTFYSLSGADYATVSLAVLTFCGVLSVALCTYVLANRFFPAALCCFISMFINDAAVLAFRTVLERTAFSNIWRVALPGCLMSMAAFPLIYWLVKCIGRTGGDYGV